MHVARILTAVLCWNNPLKIDVEVILLSTVSRPVCHSVGHSSEARHQTFITVRHLPISCCEAPSLTRRRICNLLMELLLGLVSAVTVRSKSHRTRVSVGTLPTWRAMSPYLYPPETECPILSHLTMPWPTVEVF
jgi:hypothetical protein